MLKELRQNHILKKSITILCIIVMLFCFLPMNVFAETIRQEVQADIKEVPEEKNEDVLETAEAIDDSSQTQAKENYKTTQILKEQVEKRKTNEKHFLLEDGTEVVAVYPSNIHYKENGKLVDVDNTLEGKKDAKETLKLTDAELTKQELKEKEAKIEEIQKVEENEEKQEVIQKEEKSDEIQTNAIQEENEIQKEQANETSINEIQEEQNNQVQQNEIQEETLPREEIKEQKAQEENKELIKNIKEETLESLEKVKQTEVYENKANSYKTKFTNKTKGYNLGSLTSEGYTITWRLQNAKSTNINVKNPKSNAKIQGNTIEKIQLNQIASTIQYQGILSDVNIDYVLAPEMIKENIVLENKEAIQNKFVFEYETDGLDMKLLDNNDIIVYQDNEENIKFIIRAPFMYDGKLEFTDKINLQLKKNKNKYELTVTPDREWLESEERVFPVTIDPTIQTSLYVQSINDTFIYKGDTNNTSRYLAHILRVGNGGGPSSRSLLKFTLPTLKSGDQVIAAELSINNYPNSSEWTPPTGEKVLDVHQITSNWDSKTANWSNMSSNYNTKVIDYIRYKYDSNSPKKNNRLDITTIVKDWYTTGKNYGVMLKEHAEKTVETGSDAYFYSSDIDNTYASYRPKVIIAYRNQTGIEDYLSYHTQSAGRAGQVYTNDYNGNLTLVHTDASTPGNRLPVTVEHVYNTNEKDTDIGYGKGIRLNLSQTLELTTISSKEYIRYIDEDATAHYFLKNGSIYEDEDGLGLTIKMSGDNAIMTDKSGNTMTFAKYASGNKWHLQSIKDTNNNQCTLSLITSGSNYLISQVQDAAGDKIGLTYTSGKLQKITDTAGRNTTYAYDSSGRLTSITYPDSKKSTYTYGSKNELTKAQNIDGSYLTYSYYGGTVYRVKSISEYGTDGAQGKALTITYGNNLTTLKDNRGYSNTYAFDNYGHAISVADFGKADQNINNAYGKAYKYGTSGGTNNKLTLESKLISVSDIGNNLIKNVTFDSNLSYWSKRSR